MAYGIDQNHNAAYDKYGDIALIDRPANSPEIIDRLPIKINTSHNLTTFASLVEDEVVMSHLQLKRDPSLSLATSFSIPKEERFIVNLTNVDINQSDIEIGLFSLLGDFVSTVSVAKPSKGQYGCIIPNNPEIEGNTFYILSAYTTDKSVKFLSRKINTPFVDRLPVYVESNYNWDWGFFTKSLISDDNEYSENAVNLIYNNYTNLLVIKSEYIIKTLEISSMIGYSVVKENSPSSEIDLSNLP